MISYPCDFKFLLIVMSWLCDIYKKGFSVCVCVFLVPWCLSVSLYYWFGIPLGTFVPCTLYPTTSTITTSTYTFVFCTLHPTTSTITTSTIHLYCAHFILLLALSPLPISFKPPKREKRKVLKQVHVGDSHIPIRTITCL